MQLAGPAAPGQWQRPSAVGQSQRTQRAARGLLGIVQQQQVLAWRQLAQTGPRDVFEHLRTLELGLGERPAQATLDRIRLRRWRYPPQLSRDTGQGRMTGQQ